MNTKPLHIVLLLATLCAGAAGQANAATYRSIDLGTLGGLNSTAIGINNAGQVIGSSQVLGDAGTYTHAALWNAGAAVDLEGDRNAQVNSMAYSINNAGNIVGRGTGNDGAGYSFRSNGGTLVRAAGLNGGYSAINNTGSTAGYIYDGYRSQAAVWNGGNTTLLNNVAGGGHTGVTAINDVGQSVGYAGNSPDDHAVRWDGINATDLTPTGSLASGAYDINNAGQVVGAVVSGGNDFEYHAFIWEGDTARELLTPSRRYGASLAFAINEAGQVVGTYNTGAFEAGDGAHAILWDGDATIDLDSLLDPALAQAGWVLGTANGINDRGDIVGNMRNRYTGNWHAVLLSAVPEPETYAMLLAGLGLMGCVARRRRKAA